LFSGFGKQLARISSEFAACAARATCRQELLLYFGGQRELARLLFELALGVLDSRFSAPLFVLGLQQPGFSSSILVGCWQLFLLRLSSSSDAAAICAAVEALVGFPSASSLARSSSASDCDCASNSSVRIFAWIVEHGPRSIRELIEQRENVSVKAHERGQLHQPPTPDPRDDRNTRLEIGFDSPGRS